jgi:hypothetical protein
MSMKGEKNLNPIGYKNALLWFASLSILSQVEPCVSLKPPFYSSMLALIPKTKWLWYTEHWSEWITQVIQGDCLNTSVGTKTAPIVKRIHLSLDAWAWSGHRNCEGVFDGSSQASGLHTVTQSTVLNVLCSIHINTINLIGGKYKDYGRIETFKCEKDEFVSDGCKHLIQKVEYEKANMPKS